MNQPACVCGHPHEAHEHYRPGTDCALCGPDSCRQFRAVDGLLARLGRVLLPSAAAEAVHPASEKQTISPAEPVHATDAAPPSKVQERRARNQARAYKSGPAA